MVFDLLLRHEKECIFLIEDITEGSRRIVHEVFKHPSLSVNSKGILNIELVFTQTCSKGETPLL